MTYWQSAKVIINSLIAFSREILVKRDALMFLNYCLECWENYTTNSVKELFEENVCLKEKEEIKVIWFITFISTFAAGR